MLWGDWRRSRVVVVVLAMAALATAVVLVLVLRGGDDSGRPAAALGQAQTPVVKTWLALSDVHFDPFAGHDGPLTDKLAAAPPSQWAQLLSQPNDPPSHWGADTNYTLLKSTLDYLVAVDPVPQVAVVTGDFLAHDFAGQYDNYASKKSGQDPAAYDAFVDKTIAFLALTLGQALPQTQFIPVLGNNDSYEGDYKLAPKSPFLANTAKSWQPLVARGAGAPSFASEFSQFGYYVARMPFASGSVVALNDVYWSAQYVDTCGTPGADELTWLQNTVKSLAGAPLWVLMHVPPGIDVFTSMTHGTTVGLLCDAFQQGLLAAMAPGRSTAGVFGHLHMSTWRLLPSPAGTPLLGVPSISPSFRNNPAFALLDVSTTDGSIVDYSVYSVDANPNDPGAKWSREYTFDTTYGVTHFDAAALQAIQQDLVTKPAILSSWEKYYTSGSGKGGITGSNYRYYLCANVDLTSATYDACPKSVNSGG